MPGGLIARDGLLQLLFFEDNANWCVLVRLIVPELNFAHDAIKQCFSPVWINRIWINGAPWRDSHETFSHKHATLGRAFAWQYLFHSLRPLPRSGRFWGSEKGKNEKRESGRPVFNDPFWRSLVGILYETKSNVMPKARGPWHKLHEPYWGETALKLFNYITHRLIFFLS